MQTERFFVLAVTTEGGVMLYRMLYYRTGMLHRVVADGGGHPSRSLCGLRGPWSRTQDTAVMGVRLCKSCMAITIRRQAREVRHAAVNAICRS